MLKWIRSGVVMALLAMGGVSAATASTMEMSLQEVGDDLVFDFQGEIEFLPNSSFPEPNPASTYNFMMPSAPVISSLPGPYERYDFGGVSGVPFGTGSAVQYNRPDKSTSSGDAFQFAIFPDSAGLLLLPGDYTTGDPLAGQAVFLDTTLDSIGATPGRYAYNFGGNTLSLTVGPDTAVIPLPATGVLLVFALGGLGLMHRRRHVA